MSAIGTKQTWQRRRSMSAFGDKADMTFRTALMTQSGHRTAKRWKACLASQNFILRTR
jgi:hypothetical protein